MKEDVNLSPLFVQKKASAVGIMNGRRRLSVCPSVQSAVLMLYQTSHVEAEGTILNRNETEHLCMSLSRSVSPPVRLSGCLLTYKNQRYIL